DALCAAANFILTAETLAKKTSRLVATVGQIMASPGASNVIPGEVQLTLDVRHAQDSVRNRAVDKLSQEGDAIAAARRIALEWELVHEAAAVQCDARLSSILENALGAYQPQVLRLSSGAGHDAVALAAVTPVAMLFVRCRGGVSHHPDEFV